MNKSKNYVAWFCVLMTAVGLVFSIIAFVTRNYGAAISLLLSTVTFIINGFVLFRN